MRAALCARDVFVGTTENPLNLFVEFGAVSDDEHACTRVGFEDRFCEPDHRETFPTALGVPDDAAFPAVYAFLRCFHTEELVVSADFLDVSVEDDEVV